MKREIKFRALTNDKSGHGRWVYGNYTEGQYNYHYMTNNDGSVWQIDPETVGEFTGLKDKNGKEIYEGDIVFYEDHEWKVVFEYDRWDMQSIIDNEKYVRSDDYSDDPGFTSWDFCEVIGNIYENSELIAG
jgi:uncharacterized phage protein (TIGR01671 family)